METAAPLHASLNIRGVPDHTMKGRDIMNMFEKRNNILGHFDPECTKNSVQNLIKLASDIRKKLGKQGYLIDSYLSLILQAANNTLAYEAAYEGFEMASQLRRLCYDVMDNNEAKKEHPFYSFVKQSYDEKTYTYQERFTTMYHYYIPLADNFMEYATQIFIKEQYEKLNVFLDDVKLQQLHKKITQLIRDDSMENLNQILKQRFFIAPVVMCFMQGLTDDLLYCLNYRDRETSKQIFQLLMDAQSK